MQKNLTRVEFLKKKLKGSVGTRQQMHFRETIKIFKKKYNVGTHIIEFKLKCTESSTEKTIVND